MNLLKKSLIAAGVASVALSPIAAATAAPARIAPALADDSQLGGDNRGSGLIVALVVLAALATAFVLIEDEDDDFRVVSP